MPYAKVNGIDIYYEIHGPEDGYPLALIEGWGTSLWAWFRQLPTFSKYYRVLVFDNRGVGKTSKPDEPYSIKMFADDLKGLLDHLNIEKTHVFGISMGGYIAQQFAYSYPDKVKGLVLSSTGFGGPQSRAIQPSNEVLAKMFAVPTETLTFEQAIAIRRSTAWSESFLKENKDLINKMDKWIQENPQPEYARGRQAEAALAFNSEPNLDKITAPTLILHGEKDLVVPPKNAEMLLEKIKNAQLVFFKDSPHRIEVERFEDFNHIIIDFLKKVDEGSFKPELKKKII